jgi:hypothetical protein
MLASFIARGWCRLTSPAPLTLCIACLLAVRNQRVVAAFNACQVKQRAESCWNRPRSRSPA